MALTLKETRIGGGFEKQSVLAYIKEQDETIGKLESELQSYRDKNNAQESQLIQDYKRGEEEAQKKAEQAEEKLKTVTEKATKLAEALKKEQEGRQADIQKVKKQLAETKTNSADAKKLKACQQENMELSMKVNDLNAQLDSYKTQEKDTEREMEALSQELDAKEDEISNLQKKNNSQESELVDLKAKIKNLEKELQEAENKALQNITADMFGGWMANLAKNAEKEAREQVENAKKEAEELEQEASETAEAMLAEAEERASVANAQADEILENARKQAEQELSDKLKNAELREQNSRKLADDIREILLGQLANLEENIQKINDTVFQAVEDMSNKLDEANSCIENAKTKIDESSKDIPVSEKISEPVKEIVKPVQAEKPAPEKKPVPAPEKKPVQKKEAKSTVPMMSGLESILADFEESVANEEKKIPDSKPVQEDVFSLNEKQPESANKFKLEDEEVKKTAFSIMPDMSSLLGEIENSVTLEEQKISEPAPVQENNNNDVFSLDEKQPESADTFQPEEEQILDIDSFAQKGVAFNTGIRARATGTPNKPNKKKNNDAFDLNEWANETSEEIRTQRKKKNKK